MLLFRCTLRFHRVIRCHAPRGRAFLCNTKKSNDPHKLQKYAIDRSLDVGKDVLIACAESFGGQMAKYFFISCCVAYAATLAMKKYKDSIFEQKRRLAVAYKEAKASLIEKYNAMLDGIKSKSSKARATTTDAISAGKSASESLAAVAVGAPGLALDEAKEKFGNLEVDLDELKGKALALSDRVREVNVDAVRRRGSDIKARLREVDADALRNKGRELAEDLKGMDADAVRQKGLDVKDKVRSKWLGWGNKPLENETIVSKFAVEESTPVEKS